MSGDYPILSAAASLKGQPVTEESAGQAFVAMLKDAVAPAPKLTLVPPREPEPDGPIGRCHRCGRTEGLAEPQDFGLYLVIKCDCNYQHVVLTTDRA